jgi:phage/plasmid-associated DNA primase
MRLAEARLRLEVPEGASWDAVKAAYRRLARLHHPDKSDSPEATVTMQGLAEAFGTLKRHRATASGSRDEGGGSGEAAGGSEEEEEHEDEDESDDEEYDYEDEGTDEEADEEVDEAADEGADEEDFESDGESTASADARSGAPITSTTSVWKRMAASIATAQLDDASNVQLVIDGMRTEEQRSSKGDSPIKVRGDAPDWKALARATLQRATSPMSAEALEQAWSASTVRAQGCEVLIQLSRESDAPKHDRICRDEVFSGVDGPFHERSALSEYELAMHAMLTHAHNIVVIMQPKDVDGYMLWDGGRWSHETRRSSSALESTVLNACHALLSALHDHHAAALRDAEDAALGKETIQAAQRRCSASRAALARYGNRQNRDVVQLILNMKKRMAISTAEDPFDQAKHLLPFSNGVLDLRTRAFRATRKDDYVLRTTGKEWHAPHGAKVATMRRLFESMLPREGPRRTVYSMLRLSLGALPAERLWMLTGSGRNGKGLVMGWTCFLLGEELSGGLMPMGMLTQPLVGMGATPEMRKAHRRRVLNWSEPPETAEDGAEQHPKASKRGLALLLSNIKAITGEATMQARDCNSNDSRCDLWGTAVLQCNTPPRIVGTIDDSALERLVVVHFPFTFTSDAEKLRSDPAKYKPIDGSLKGAAFMKEHYCALVQLLLDECPDGAPFIAPECKQAASAYLGKQDKLQSFLDEHCVRRETAPMRQWLGVKEMLATYNAEMGATLKEKDLKEKLKSHRATSADYKEKGQAVLSDAPLRRNTANGLLHWQLKAADEGEASGSKRQRVE